jgi:DNA-binding NarL/FixJ family response regulator
MNQTKRIRLLCVDDHPVVLDGLTAIIGMQPDMAVVAQATDGEAAIIKYREHRPDVVVMDLRMPGLDGVEATLHIRQEFPTARIIVLTTYEGDEDIHRALQAGAQAYLLKDMVRTELMQTIRDVLAGHRHISAVAAAKLAEHTPRISLSERRVASPKASRQRPAKQGDRRRAGDCRRHGENPYQEHLRQTRGD